MLRHFPLTAVVVGVLAGSPPLDAAASETGGPAERGWTVHLDNDLFALGDEDRDYTAGAAFTLSGEAARSHALSLARPLGWIDRRIGFGRLGRNAPVEGHALEVGLLLFSPLNLAAREPLPDDRPYANLLYTSSSTLRLDASRGIAYQSSLTFGFLGLPIAEQLHKAVHKLVGSVQPMGYANQISDGGEPTLRYAVSRYDLLTSGTYAGRPFSIRLGLEGSLGYVTEAGAELALRWGGSDLPWWSSPPVASDYAGHPPISASRPATDRGHTEFVLDAGVKLRARLYNSFLQGQFRDSAVTYSASELNHLLLEAWVGVTALLPNDLSVSYTLRYQSEEIEDGIGARGFTWAGIGVTQRF